MCLTISDNRYSKKSCFEQEDVNLQHGSAQLRRNQVSRKINGYIKDQDRFQRMFTSSHKVQIQALCSVANHGSVDSTFLNKWNITDKVSFILILLQPSCSRSAGLRYI
jgi:hypothetical protein